MASRHGAMGLVVFVTAVVIAAVAAVVGGWAWLDRGAPVVVPAGPTEAAATGRLEDAEASPANAELRPVGAERSALPPGSDDSATLAASGNARWRGRVIDFDALPAPGAALWWGGKPIGVSDAEGSFDLAVTTEGWRQYRWKYDGDFAWDHIVAVSDGVGCGAAPVDDEGREIEIRLDWRTRLSGMTLESGSERVVPGAHIELVAFGAHIPRGTPAFRLETDSDATGAYSFSGLPPQSVALRATADEHASAGWFAADLTGDEDHAGVRFQLMRRVQVRGWFSPWPPRMIAEGAIRGADLRLVALPKAIGDVAREFERFEVPIDDEGRFDFKVAASFDCDLRLMAGDGAL
ncbi:MAG: hypothetical protein EXS13_04285 [Planctomycetes bacterium]|nr:hypothetical protein [Planctomycetota bacterium]